MASFLNCLLFSWALLPLLTANEVPLPCVFPFTYKQRSYSSCTKDDASDGQLWCATTANYDTHSQWKPCALHEYGGSSNGQPCVFPFAYKKWTFYTCTNEDAEHGRFWCATTGSYDQNEEWSYCADSRLNADPTGPCIFPFIYKGKSYSSCTTDGSSTGKLWCSLTSNYDTSPKWTYCDPSESVPCTFPFISNGKSYSACTNEGAADNTLWCATTANYDRDGKWKACSFQEYEGNSKGKPCVFPFIYGGRTFYTCTNENSENGAFWCATTADYDKDKEWSYCADTRLNANPTGPCVFPFIYKGKSYSSCTTDGASSGKRWCSLRSNYDVDPKWTFCDPSGVISVPSNEVNDHHSDVFDNTTLRWVVFQGSIPEGAVFFWNSYAERYEYPCSESNCRVGFYDRSRGSYCFFPFQGKERKVSDFWLLVNEKNLELLEWHGGSLGSIPSNSINTCKNKRYYIAKNEYGIGNLDKLNAFYIGSNGHENWYTSYSVLTVNKDYKSQSIFDVKYRKEEGVFKRKPIILASSRVTSHNCKPVKKTTVLSKTVTLESRWDFSTSLSLNVGTTMTARVPRIADMEWVVSAETSFPWSQGSTHSQSVTYSATVEVDIPPIHSCEVEMEGTEMKADIPCTATVSRSYKSGVTHTATVVGVSCSVAVTKGSIIKRCIPIPHTPTCSMHET